MILAFLILEMLSSRPLRMLKWSRHSSLRLNIDNASDHNGFELELPLCLEPNPAQQVDISRVGAQVIEHRVDLQID